jgi:hypothetical protein
VVPVLLGDGERLFDNLGDAEAQLEQVRAVRAKKTLRFGGLFRERLKGLEPSTFCMAIAVLDLELR